MTKTFDVKQGAVHAVQDVNLKIEDGHIYGIVGYSGAGKSTLVRMLNGLETPTSGSVVIDDVNITTLSGAKLRAVPNGKKSAWSFNISTCCGHGPC